MTRLPKMGEETWGEVLNEFLLVAHNPDGTQRKASTDALATTAVTRQLFINVTDYGAAGDGVTDDTAAIQAAIDAAPHGGAVLFPSGIFMVTGLKINNKGTGLVGAARWGTRLARLSGTDPLIDASGTTAILGHLRYFSLNNIMLDGSSKPGTLLRSYYADNCICREVNFINCPGMATDLIEVWDTRFEDCTWENCGSITQPALLMRNSMPLGEFGYSTDNTNQVHFVSCRWEGFRNGAVWLDGAANGSTKLLNSIFFVACKMETSSAAGSALQLMLGTTVVFVTQMYIAILALDANFNGRIDAISDSATHTLMSNVYVQWGAGTGLANTSVHILRSGPHMYQEFSAYYPDEDPLLGTLVAEATTDVLAGTLWTNRGLLTVGNVQKLLGTNPRLGTTIPLDNTGTFRITSSINGSDLLKVDNDAIRPSLLLANGIDSGGYSDAYISEKWRIVGATGAARFAAGKFQIESTKGYVGINATPFTGIAMLIRAGIEGDRGIAVVRPSSTATNRLMEFQDEAYNIQGMAIDSNGRPIAVGTPPRVTAGAQATYANPGIQVRDVAGNITAAVRPTPTAPGAIATITFSRPYAATPLSITLSDNSAVSANLYVSARSATSFTVSTRNALGGGAILNFDYVVIA